MKMRENSLGEYMPANEDGVGSDGCASLARRRRRGRGRTRTEQPKKMNIIISIYL